MRAGGIGRITTDALAVVVPQAFVTANDTGKVPAVGKDTEPGIKVVALEGVPPVNVQE
ncbi:hypothetical protein D3C80_1346730 [compost metagenome]